MYGTANKPHIVPLGRPQLLIGRYCYTTKYVTLACLADLDSFKSNRLIDWMRWQGCSC